MASRVRRSGIRTVRSRVEFTGLEAFLDDLKPHHVERPPARLFAAAAPKLASYARGFVRTDTGGTRAEITARARPDAGEVAVPMYPAVFQHQGTRPHFPPVGKVAEWAGRHGLDPGDAFPIARAIARRGTKRRPFLRRALNTFRRQDFGRLLQGAARDIEAEWRR